MPLEQTNYLSWLAGCAPVCTSRSDVQQRYDTVDSYSTHEPLQPHDLSDKPLLWPVVKDPSK